MNLFPPRVIGIAIPAHHVYRWQSTGADKIETMADLENVAEE